MRDPLFERVQLLSNSKDLDLSLKLKDLTSDSYFAVHYNFLKSHAIPPVLHPLDKVPQASFLVYYKIVPEIERVVIMGVLPFRNEENLGFWH